MIIMVMVIIVLVIWWWVLAGISSIKSVVVSDYEAWKPLKYEVSFFVKRFCYHNTKYFRANKIRNGRDLRFSHFVNIGILNSKFFRVT